MSIDEVDFADTCLGTEWKKTKLDPCQKKLYFRCLRIWKWCNVHTIAKASAQMIPSYKKKKTIILWTKTSGQYMRCRFYMMCRSGTLISNMTRQLTGKSMIFYVCCRYRLLWIVPARNSRGAYRDRDEEQWLVLLFPSFMIDLSRSARSATALEAGLYWNRSLIGRSVLIPCKEVDMSVTSALASSPSSHGCWEMKCGSKRFGEIILCSRL